MGNPDPYEKYRAQRYFPFFDGLRYLLVAVVVLDHAGRGWPILNGGVAVLVFFVMSGYLITTLLCREDSGAGSVSMLRFFRRRIFRIVPLFYTTIPPTSCSPSPSRGPSLGPSLGSCDT